MFNSLSSQSKPVFDPALGDPLGKIILAEARQGKFNTLLREVNLLRDGEWDRRAFYIDLAGEYLAKGKSPEEFPDTSLGNLVKGAYATNYAWKARGSGTADTVSKKGWSLFFERLGLAQTSLLRATEQDPEDPTPFAFLQTVAMGLQLNRKIAEIWLNEAIQRDPLNQQAHYRHLFLLCKKWGGSHKESMPLPVKQ